MKYNNKGNFSRDNFRKELPQSINPFEVLTNRSKHQVLGRKLKSDRGLPGFSKNKALIKRKKTILQEYKTRNRSNQFIDQRIGEKNKNMREDDILLARFAVERMRVFNKKTMFYLSETEVLTHKGQPLSKIEHFKDTRSDDEDVEERRNNGALKGEFVESAHFGGGLLTKGKQDRESLIDELINESKKRKAERQRNNEKTLEATEQLDQEWKTLSVIVTSTKNTRDYSNQQKDQYDIVMRKLKFEPHGQPSQRLKTEEETAKEDIEYLEKLEKERLKRLRGIEVSKHGFLKSADDLYNGFGKFTDTDLTESGSDVESRSEAESFKEKEDGEDKEENNLEKEENSEPVVKRLRCTSNDKESAKYNIAFENIDEEESSDDVCAMDDFSDIIPSLEDLFADSTNREAVPTSQTGIMEEKDTSSIEYKLHDNSQLPFVLNIPDNYVSFMELLVGRTKQQQSLIFERIIKSNHPFLKTENKKKMLKLAEYIFQAVRYEHFTWESLPLLVSQFNVLKEFNKEECFKMLVDNVSVKLEEVFTEDVQADLQVYQLVFLTWFIMLFLQPQNMDMLVPISKPALNLACSQLKRIDSPIIGILCCFLLLQDAKMSSAVYPEAIIYLHNCIKSTADSKNKISEKKQGTTESKVDTEDETMQDFRLQIELGLCTPVLGVNVADDHKSLYCSVMLLSGFVNVYRKYPQSKIMFRKVQQTVNNLKADGYPPVLSKEIIELQTLLQALSSASLPSLAKNTKKPKALRQYEPSFHVVTLGRSQRGLSSEQQEEQKLLHKYKQELKGAIRELRRDRVFLANVRLREKALSDKQRMKKVKEIFSSGATQQGELRNLKRKK